MGGSDKLQGVASREETANSHPRDVPWTPRLSARRPGDFSEAHARRPGDGSLVANELGLEPFWFATNSIQKFDKIIVPLTHECQNGRTA